MMKRFLIIVLFWIGVVSVGSATTRKFTSTEGKSITATILSVQGDKVELQRADGRRFLAPINRFTIDDGLFIKKWQEENKGVVPPHLRDRKPRLAIEVSTGKTSRKDDKESGYVDERKQKMAFRVSVENQDQVYPIDTVRVTLMVVGESPETRRKAVVYKQVFDGEKLPLNETRVLAATPFELWYDDDGAMYGYKYKGYFVVVQDPQGKILAERTIPGSAAKNAEDLLKLKGGDEFDSKYQPLANVSMERSVKVGL